MAMSPSSELGKQKAMAMSNTVDQNDAAMLQASGAKFSAQGVGKRLETWLTESIWMLWILRNESETDDVIHFTIVVSQFGNEIKTWAVPTSALENLGEVFAYGGSFVSAALIHMPECWVELIRIDPIFQALADKLALKSTDGIKAGVHGGSAWQRAL